MTVSMKTAYQIAKDYVGTKEVPGKKHNPEVVQMFADVGHDWVKDDETPWCAAFVGAVLAEAGMRGTGKLNARSYAKWGEEVAIEDAAPGDIVVFWRESPSSWKGHVGFFDSMSGPDTINVVGGNQSDSVRISGYPERRLLSVRRAPTPRKSAAETRTVKATAAQVGGSAAAGATAVSQLDGVAQIVAVGACVAVALLALWIMRDRIRKFASGDT